MTDSPLPPPGAPLGHYVSAAPFDPMSVEAMTLEQERVYQASQLRLMWWKFRRHKLALWSGIFLICLYTMILFCEFLAPYNLHTRNVDHIFEPPQRIRLFDNGIFVGPFVYGRQMTLDIENLRRHYTKTLAEWRRRFEGATAAVARMFDPSFVRLWRLYLAGSEAAFDTGYLQLFQVLFARATTNDGWWTRREVYASPGASCPPALPVHADLPPFLE